MDGPTWKVLQKALKKWVIQSSADGYSLCLMWDNVQRGLEDYEEPLQIFKDLEHQGKKPTFMVRKSNAANLWKPTQEGPYVTDRMDFGTELWIQELHPRLRRSRHGKEDNILV